MTLDVEVIATEPERRKADKSYCLEQALYHANISSTFFSAREVVRNARVFERYLNSA